MAKSAPKSFHLTSEEQLRIENLQLKRQMLQQASAELDSATSFWRLGIEKRLRVSLQDYTVNASTGECTINIKPLKAVSNV